MPKFRVTAIAPVEVVTYVEADTYEEAEEIAEEREVMICIHGSEFAAGGTEDSEFVLTDGSTYQLEHINAEEVD